MEREERLPSSSSSLGHLVQCRICHEEEDEACTTMESPCSCSGSLKYAHRGCVQRWCDEKGSTFCEICLQNFQPGYTMPPKKTPIVEITISEHEDMPSVESRDSLIDGSDYTPYSSADRGAIWCRSLMITFTIMLLVWHLVAVVTVEATDHCAFSLLTIYLLRAAGILLPFYIAMQLILLVQRGRQQHRLQMLEDQIRNASTMTRNDQEQHQLVISII